MRNQHGRPSQDAGAVLRTARPERRSSPSVRCALGSASMRRATQTGTGRGQIIGVASIDFYAGPDRRLKGCTVHRDSDPGFVPLLPALAFDEYLPNVRLIGVSTDAGEGVIVGEHAQQVRLGEFEVLDRRRRQPSGPRRSAAALRARCRSSTSTTGQGDLAAQTDFTVRINGKKERLWGEARHTTPDGVSDVVFSRIPGVLWDWVAAIARPAIENALFLDRMRSQAAYYRAHGIPSDFQLREIGRAPFAVWRETPGIPLRLDERGYILADESLATSHDGCVPADRQKQGAGRQAERDRAQPRRALLDAFAQRRRWVIYSSQVAASGDTAGGLRTPRRLGRGSTGAQVGGRSHAG